MPNGLARGLRIILVQNWSNVVRTSIAGIAAFLLLELSEAGAQEARLVSSLLPQSRSVEVGQAATAFATVINPSQVTAQNCSIRPSTVLPAVFDYQTTDPTTNALTGAPNTPVDIAPGAAQTFVITFSPLTDLSRTAVRLRFSCENAQPATLRDGVNIFYLSATDADMSEEPDIIALAATIQGDGFVHFPHPTGVGVFAIATINVGAAGTITVRADSGDSNPPVTYEICETNPVTGACLSPRSAFVTRHFNEGDTPTFSVFARPAGFVPRAPAIYRAVVRFTDEAGSERGSTSVAMSTTSGNPPEAQSASLFFPDGTDYALADSGSFQTVRYVVTTEGFEIGEDGELQIYVNDRLAATHSEPPYNASLELPHGRQILLARLSEFDGRPSFPDARAQQVITIGTDAPRALRVAAGQGPFVPYSVVRLEGDNLFPLSEQYPATINGVATTLIASSRNIFSFMIPEIAGFTGEAIFRVNIEGEDFEIPVIIEPSETVPLPSDSGAYIQNLFGDTIGALEALRAASNTPETDDAYEALIAYYAELQNSLNGLNGDETELIARIFFINGVHELLDEQVGLSYLLFQINTIDSCATNIASAISILNYIDENQLMLESIINVGAVAVGIALWFPPTAPTMAAIIAVMWTVPALNYIWTSAGRLYDVVFDCADMFVENVSARFASDLTSADLHDGANQEATIVFMLDEEQSFDLTLSFELPSNANSVVRRTIELLDGAIFARLGDIVRQTLEILNSLLDGSYDGFTVGSTGLDLYAVVTEGDVQVQSFAVLSDPDGFAVSFHGSQSTPFIFEIRDRNGRISPYRIEAELVVPAPLPEGLTVWNYHGQIAEIDLPFGSNVTALQLLDLPPAEFGSVEIISQSDAQLRYTPPQGFSGQASFFVRGADSDGERVVNVRIRTSPPFELPFNSHITQASVTAGAYGNMHNHRIHSARRIAENHSATQYRSHAVDMAHLDGVPRWAFTWYRDQELHLPMNERSFPLRSYGFGPQLPAFPSYRNAIDFNPEGAFGRELRVTSASGDVSPYTIGNFDPNASPVDNPGNTRRILYLEGFGALWRRDVPDMRRIENMPLFGQSRPETVTYSHPSGSATVGYDFRLAQTPGERQNVVDSGNRAVYEQEYRSYAPICITSADTHADPFIPGREFSAYNPFLGYPEQQCHPSADCPVGSTLYSTRYDASGNFNPAVTQIPNSTLLDIIPSTVRNSGSFSFESYLLLATARPGAVGEEVLSLSTRYGFQRLVLGSQGVETGPWEENTLVEQIPVIVENPGLSTQFVSINAGESVSGNFGVTGMVYEPWLSIHLTDPGTGEPATHIALSYDDRSQNFHIATRPDARPGFADTTMPSEGPEFQQFRAIGFGLSNFSSISHPVCGAYNFTPLFPDLVFSVEVQ